MYTNKTIGSNSKGDNGRKNKLLNGNGSKRRKINHISGGSNDRYQYDRNDGDEIDEDDVIIDEQDRIHQQQEEERKKKILEAIKPKTVRINSSTTQTRSNGIDALCIDHTSSDTLVSIATRNGVVQEWSVEKKQVIAETKLQHFSVPNAMTKTKSPLKKQRIPIFSKAF